MEIYAAITARVCICLNFRHAPLRFALQLALFPLIMNINDRNSYEKIKSDELLRWTGLS